MMTPRKRALLIGVVAVLIIGTAIATSIASSWLPVLGAGGVLHPGRRHVEGGPPPGCDEATFDGLGVTLRGWRCPASGRRLATIVYLHGIADNRTSSAGVIQRFGSRGFDVVAYDSRAHGESEGEMCTYGVLEKQDLHRVLDAVPESPIVLVGTSLGAAVALQEAAQDARVSAIVAAETFSDLRTVATERAPFFYTKGAIGRAFELVEEQGHFDVDAASPVKAAAKIAAPVLLIHGEADVDTPPDHSRRVFAALGGPKRLIIVPGAGHNRSLQPDVWNEIERWLDAVLARADGAGQASTPRSATDQH